MTSSRAVRLVTLERVVCPPRALGGGGAAHTDAINAQIWEAFTFDDLNGGTLVDGDKPPINLTI